MAISGVLRAGTIQIKVTELDAALVHYTEVIGLVKTAEGPDGRVPWAIRGVPVEDWN